jgi:hypothetical protein
MTLFETEEWNQIQQQGYEIGIRKEEGPEYVFSIPESDVHQKQRLALPESQLKIEYHDMIENAIEEVVVTHDASMPNKAIQITLSSERVGLNQNLWLIERDSENTQSSSVQMGPATIVLKTEDQESVSNPMLILSREGHELLRLDLTRVEKSIPIDQTELTLTNLEYFPSAKVQDNRLVSSPDDVIFNPAVQFEIRNARGDSEKHTRFMLFPNFDSLHGRESHNPFNLSVELKAPLPQGWNDVTPPSLIFSSPNGVWAYQSHNTQGESRGSAIEVGKSYETGWMDMTFTVKNIYETAAVSRGIIKSPDPKEGRVAALITAPSVRNEEERFWITTNRPATFETQEGWVTVNLGLKSFTLPFSLKLSDFRKVDYPGTQSAASFESDVILTDAANQVRLEKKIQMNEPLDYAGFRIFQSSFIQDPNLGEASVFTIAKNPGIWFIYIGGMIILAGVITLFYVAPFSNSGKVHE